MTTFAHHQPIVSTDRRGSVVPAVAIMMLVLLGAAALILDRTWLDTAQVEMTTVAEAAALAAGGELASDDLLRTTSDPAERVAAAEAVAAKVAAENFVAGQPVILRTGEDGDIRIGRIARSESTGESRFVETIHNPNVVEVGAHRERSRENPVALFLQKIGGVAAGDVSGFAEASIDNRILGVRGEENAPIPALPLAILADTWQQQIVARAGKDAFGYDRQTGKITQKADGIPEVNLTGMIAGSTGGVSAAVTVRLVHFRRRMNSDQFTAQIARGWALDDLPGDNHELMPAIKPEIANATATLGKQECDALRALAGECRIVLLYQPIVLQNGQVDPNNVQCTGFVAGRVLQVTFSQQQPPQIVFQPGVLVTRTAVTPAESDFGLSDGQAEKFRNPYIYELRLTR